MAMRPVFVVPDSGETRLIEERFFEFRWASGFSEIQKKKNIRALHAAAREGGLKNILEISTKSFDEIGRRLSAFSLKIDLGGEKFPLESVYQGSKVFEGGGPFNDVFELPPREAKRLIRERERDCGLLVGFELEGKRYPRSPTNAFYDWIYIRTLKDKAEWINENVNCRAFTDIEFNPAKQFNCQARAFAEYMSLLRRSALELAADDFDAFVKMLSQSDLEEEHFPMNPTQAMLPGLSATIKS